ncbi:phenoloxidase-activating factor 2-like [Homalodisca vitripennis]|uniref:phenoloxidase-activating factor 2-like n=1 Tax=Homalodisca vitripennis TaxID=197043 RepID=UPI001EEB4D13|nr:phenoloxidase-activating factor 2-like [Homalodisca vitripennis]
MGWGIKEAFTRKPKRGYQDGDCDGEPVGIGRSSPRSRDGPDLSVYGVLDLCIRATQARQPLSLQTAAVRGRTRASREWQAQGNGPGHAAILEKDNAVYVCGASLIDESWVLTAAHCVEKLRVLGADSSPLCGEVVSGLFILPDKDRTNLQAAILEKDNAVYVCGASLIDESWVLTAAHCVEKFIRSIQLLKVRLGEHDVSTTDEPTEHEERNVAQVVVHPNFDNKTLVNDLALVRLEKAARRRSNIDIVCVPSDQLPLSRNKTCYVTGWGKQTEDSNHSVVLKEIPVPLWENQACEKALRTSFGARFSLPPTAVCAGAEGRDAC